MAAVKKVLGYFCQPCGRFFTEQECSMDDHCKEEGHYENFVTYVKEQLAERKKLCEEEEDEPIKVIVRIIHSSLFLLF